MLWFGVGWIDVTGGALEPVSRAGGGGSAAQVEVDGDADAAGGLLPVHDRRIEAPLLGGGDRGAVEVAVAAGLLDRHVDDVAVGVDIDDQDHRALDAGAD